MRINAGKWKGRPLRTVEGLSTRPTPDMVKQAIFNIIRDEISNALFCDLFAGTGSVAFEALSRGAKHICLVENSKPALDVIKYNAEYLGCTDNMTLVSNDVFVALKLMSGKKFDIIFFDPPYNKGLEREVLSAIAEKQVINENGWIIIQFETKNSIAKDIPEGFNIVDERRYGRSSLIFLRPDINLI